MLEAVKFVITLTFLLIILFIYLLSFDLYVRLMVKIWGLFHLGAFLSNGSWASLALDGVS